MIKRLLGSTAAADEYNLQHAIAWLAIDSMQALCRELAPGAEDLAARRGTLREVERLLVSIAPTGSADAGSAPAACAATVVPFAPAADAARAEKPRNSAAGEDSA